MTLTACGADRGALDDTMTSSSSYSSLITMTSSMLACAPVDFDDDVIEDDFIAGSFALDEEVFAFDDVIAVDLDDAVELSFADDVIDLGFDDDVIGFFDDDFTATPDDEEVEGFAAVADLTEWARGWGREGALACKALPTLCFPEDNDGPWSLDLVANGNFLTPGFSKISPSSTSPLSTGQSILVTFLSPLSSFFSPFFSPVFTAPWLGSCFGCSRC